MLGVAQPEPIEERQRGITGEREEPRQNEAIARHRGDRLEHPGKAIWSHLVPHQVDGSSEGEHDEKRQQAPPARAFHPFWNISRRGRFLCRRRDITANLLAWPPASA